MKLASIFLALIISFSGFALSIADPSPAHCSDNGGINETLYSNLGAFEACRIGPAYIGSWTLYEELMFGNPTAAVRNFFKLPQKPINPGTAFINAENYCTQVNGGVVRYYNRGHRRTERIGFCVFADNSKIGLRTLWEGPGVHNNLAVLFIMG